MTKSNTRGTKISVGEVYALLWQAETNPAYRLAVIDTTRKYEPVPPDPDGAIRYAVVRMEGE